MLNFDFARPQMAIVSTLGAALLLGACTSAPFSYAEDRCLGRHNQCQTQCTSIDSGPARAACEQRCFTVEDRCYASGADSSGGSSLAEESLIGQFRSEAEKEADYKAWKAQKERERAASEAAKTEGAASEDPQ